MTCRTCKWLNVKPDKVGRIVVRKDTAYPCVVEVPIPPLPDSITRAYGFSWPKSRSSMAADQGENCPFYVQREKPE